MFQNWRCNSLSSFTGFKVGVAKRHSALVIRETKFLSLGSSKWNTIQEISRVRDRVQEYVSFAKIEGNFRKKLILQERLLEVARPAQKLEAGTSRRLYEIW